MDLGNPEAAYEFFEFTLSFVYEKTGVVFIFRSGSSFSSNRMTFPLHDMSKMKEHAVLFIPPKLLGN